ncbi:MAG: hypothetical protein ACJAYU_002296 [Bradymonadia bacterium]|jgi:hypothetical protein
MSNQKTKTSEWQTESSNNSVRLMTWTGAWLLSTALAAFGPKLIWDFHTGLTIVGVLLNLSVGFGMILATKRHLQSMDEMQQMIFRDAAVLTLGVGLVSSSSYELLEDIQLITFEPEISHVILLMGLTFFVGMILGDRKYR